MSIRSGGRGSRRVSVSVAQAISFRLTKHHLCPKTLRATILACGSAAPGVCQTERLSHAPPISQVVQAISGVQAQVASAASLALRARIRSLSPEDVVDALWVKRDLVKTWCMRSTLHYLPSEDLPLYLAGLAPAIALRDRRWMATRGLDMTLLERMIEAVVEALSDGPLTRQEIGSRVVAQVGEEARPWVEHSWGGVIKQACLRGLVCFGPDRGGRVTFVRLDQWLPRLQRLSDSEGSSLARAKVLEQYLEGYGPATIQDFAFWSGMPVKDAAEARSILGSGAVEVLVDGTPAMVMQQDLETLALAGENAAKQAEQTTPEGSEVPTSAGVAGVDSLSCARRAAPEDVEVPASAGVAGVGSLSCARRAAPEDVEVPASAGVTGVGSWPCASGVVNLLASFDPFLLGHRDKSVLVEEEHYKKVFRKAGWVSPVILIGGRVAGTWDYTRLGKRLRVVLRPFGGVSSEVPGVGPKEMPCELRRKLQDEVDDVGRFLGFDQIEVNME